MTGFNKRTRQREKIALAGGHDALGVVAFLLALDRRLISHTLNGMDSPILIAHKAISGQPLTNDERSKLTPELLANLAIGGQLSLTRPERDRLPPLLLANLAIGRQVVLDADEFNRLPESVRFVVQQSIR